MGGEQRIGESRAKNRSIEYERGLKAVLALKLYNKRG